MDGTSNKDENLYKIHKVNGTSKKDKNLTKSIEWTVCLRRMKTLVHKMDGPTMNDVIKVDGSI